MNEFDDHDAFDAAALPLSQQAMAARPAPYLDGLNPAQRAAVEALDGPVLMLAGAGTGKTRALTCRIAHLLNMGRARPHEILAVTFTNKAAREMKERVAQLLGQSVEGLPWLGTFHAIGVKLLRRHAELAGLQPGFTILDTDDQIRLLKQEISAAGIDEKRWPARHLAGIIDNWKNRAWRPETLPAGEADAFDGRGPALYAAYQARLRALNAVDFGDLLLHVVTIFQTHPDVLEQYQRRFRHILVDEYQDTNVAQYLWLRLLAGAHRNICCVGDDDQSIYGWRGAEVGNILRFEQDFPGAQVVRLEQNYRSTPHILAAAGSLIAANAGRLGKTLWTEAEGGERVRLVGHWDGEEEARWIGEEIEALQRGTRGHTPFGLDQMAILVRASHQMRAFEDRFLSIGLPYRVIGGPRFYERMEIRDAMAYFRLAVSPGDDLAFERVVNTPKRGLGDKAQQKIQTAARAADVPLTEGARRLLDSGGLSGKAARELRTLIDGITRWHESVRAMAGLGPGGLTTPGTPDDDDLIEIIAPEAAGTGGGAPRNHIELAERILDESGYTAHWQNDKSPDAPGRLENLKELVKALEQFDNLQGFLEHVALIMDNETDAAGEKVSIMTLHGAKGLEFPVVFLPGWEDGLFPSQRSMDESGLKGLEEERRLAYVGITRAEEICTISFAANRRVYGQWQSQLPSRFVDELPVRHVEVLTPPGLYGGLGGRVSGFAGRNGTEEPDSGTLETRAARADVYNSPGWKRLQAHGGARVAPASAARPARARSAEEPSAFGEGERVFHAKFGYGHVTGVDGDKLRVAFDKAGEKHVIAQYLVAAERAGDVPF
ncbi:ATP-dependent helicase [Alkalilacustris brevis]|uniref:ATP-dependent helicase n=1 Tax=Alkalilacustris brevis TaxID=2026338 RepID=UPI000E0DE4C3|nr:UvrD-helicase domain-containing protein [Alkalilacustris brevis]